MSDIADFIRSRTSHEVRARLQQYLLGAESVEAFHNWFVVEASRLRRAGDVDDVVRTVELRLAEFVRGDWTEPELRGQLLEVLPAATFGIAEGSPAATFGVAEGSSEPWVSLEDAFAAEGTGEALHLRTPDRVSASCASQGNCTCDENTLDLGAEHRVDSPQSARRIGR